MKNLAKKLLRLAAPRQFAALSSARSNRHGQRVLEQHGVPLLAEQFLAKYGAMVQSGPFAGMRYLDASIGSSFLPKLIGSYECELHPIIQKTLVTPYQSVVDVGSAEGYYAVGLARNLAGKPKVYAFDTDIAAQELCRQLADINDVKNQVVVAGYCDFEKLQSSLQGRALLICDCEGYELQLLDPKEVPALLTTEIIVELHDTPQIPVTPQIEARFTDSHSIEIISIEVRNPNLYPILDFFEPAQQQVALSEFRSGIQQWAHLVPNAWK